MYLLESNPGGGGDNAPTCRSCKGLILPGQPSTRIDLGDDPDGAQGITGEYHLACSEPYSSIVRALNMLSRFGR